MPVTEAPYICIFSALFSPSTGGVEVFTEHLSKQLTKMGHRVLVVTSNTHSGPPDETIDGVRIIRLPCKPLMGGRLPIPKRNAEYHALIDMLEQLPIDAVLINTRFYPHSLAGAELAKRKDVHPVILDHGSAHLTLGNPLFDIALRAYEHEMTRRIKRYDADFYGISQASAAWLAHFGIQAKGVINNALNADEFIRSASSRDLRHELGIKDDDFLACFTGRLVPEKGIRALLDAADLLKENSRIHFVFAGDGPLLDEVQNGLQNVHALGRIPREDIAALLLASDVFCLPTRSEGFSTSLLEAACCNCTPIITDVGGVAEIIPDERYGVVIPDTQADTIANALTSLADDPAGTHAMAERLQQHAAACFTWEATAQAVLASVR